MTIRYQVHFDPDLSASQRRAVLRAFRDAERFLDGSGRTGRCSPVDFAFDVVQGGAPRPGYVQLEVDEVRWPTDRLVAPFITAATDASGPGTSWRRARAGG